MAKKAAAKKAKKPANGMDPNALGLKGLGVAVVRIAAITKAINEYEDIKTQRCALTPQEVKTKQKVIELMEKNEDKLRNPTTGNLEYHLDDNRYVVIEPAKVKIRFRDEKPEKKKGKGKSEDLEPEAQLAQDQQD
jgi:hypothetical protein